MARCSNLEATCAVDDMVTRVYSVTTKVIFMKLGEVKLDKQCYILPSISFP